MTTLPQTETELNNLFAKLDSTAALCVTILNSANPTRPCRWISSGLSATFSLESNRDHSVSIEIDAMHRNGALYLRIRTNIHSQGLPSRDYGALIAHLAGINALVVACRTVCDAAGFAEPQ